MKTRLNKNILLILLILVLAILVRSYGLTFESIWLDESFSIYYAQQSITQIVSLPDTNPPLYNLVLSPFVKIFGIGKFWVRLPSVIFGVLSVLFMYLLTKKIFNQRIALIASLILSISSYHVFYSQEARVYALFNFLSIISMYFFIRYFKSTKKMEAFYYILFTALLAYSHNFGLFIILTQNIFYVTINFIQKDHIKIKKWFIIQFLLLVAYSPWILHLLKQIILVNNNFWITKSHLIFLTFLPFLFGGGIILGLLYTALSIRSISYFIRDYNNSSLIKKQIFLLMILWMFLPIIISFIYSLLISPIFFHRYVIYCSLPMYILVAYSINKLTPKLKYVVLTLLILFSFYYVFDQTNNIDKERWEETSSYVKSIVDDGEIVIVNPRDYLMPFSYYYSPDCFKNTNIFKCASEEKIFTILDYHKKKSPLIINANSIVYIDLKYFRIKKDNIFELLNKDYNLISVKKILSKPHSHGEITLFVYIANRYQIKSLKELLKNIDTEITIYKFSKN